jgi:hypothetical protein
MAAVVGTELLEPGQIGKHRDHRPEQDVELEAGVIHVQDAIQNLDVGWRFVKPKSAKSRRKLTLGAMPIDALRRGEYQFAHQASPLAKRALRSRAMNR